MSTRPRHAAVLALAAGLAACAAEPAGTALEQALAGAGPGDELAVVIRLRGEPLEPSTPGLRPDRAAVVRALRRRFEARRPGVAEALAAGGARRVTDLWAINGLAATAPAALVRALAADPRVEAIALDVPVQAPAALPGAPGAPAEWNLAAIGAPALWGRGVDGAGAVVAALDTGASLDHPDLAAGFRAGPGDWLDPFRHTARPYDVSGHGTQVLGLAVGGAAGGTAIGVAPGARWIAAKVYDDAGRSSASVLHQAFQWALDPDGDPATDDAPDVVNASWGSVAAGTCDATFQPDLDALRAAGILVVFAAGNAGPAPGSSVSPANNAGALSAGAVDATGAVWGFSARGPSACTGGVFPDLVAPGVDVLTSDLAGGYLLVTGTSAAAPHVAGAAALLRAAFPGATVPALEAALRAGARDLAPAGPDQESGAGALDVERAWRRLARRSPLALAAGPRPPCVARAPCALALTATGGTPPRRFALASGALPGGLALDAATGVIAGTPSAAGTAHLLVELRDRSGQVATAPLVVDVLPAGPPRLAPGDLPSGAVAVAYGAGLQAAGGLPPLAWALTAGALPPGLALHPAHGYVAGVPTAPGAFAFTLRATGADGQWAERPVTVTVAAGAPAITTGSLRSARVGVACARALQAAGGLPPYRWGVTGGALPAGLSLSAADGVLAGTPAAAGTYTFSVELTDAAGGVAVRTLAMAVL